MLEPQLGTALAFAVLPLAMILFRWIGKKIRQTVGRLKDGRLKNILLLEIYTDTE